MPSPILTATDLTIGYAHPRKAPHIVAGDLTLALHPGELVCLLGPNGAGKSTLIRTLIGMQPPIQGQVCLSGRPIAGFSPQERARQLSVVLTDRIGVGLLTARNLVALGRYPYTDWTGRLAPEDHRIITWALQAVDADDLSDRPVAELSDGERQKVLIARALSQEPDLIVLDEPTAFLDLPRRVEIMGLLRRLSHTTGKAVLLSIHDLDLALRWADRIFLLPPGGPLHTGAPEDLVLNGAFESAFSARGVAFDPATGAFKMDMPSAHTIALIASGAHALWTARALERAGFAIQPSSQHRVEVITPNGAPVWQLTIDHATTDHHSLYDLMQALRRHTHALK